MDKHPSLELDQEFLTKGCWEDDWESSVPNCIHLDFPCFILFRLDEKDSSGNFMWVLISWSPDNAHTRYETYLQKSFSNLCMLDYEG